MDDSRTIDDIIAHSDEALKQLKEELKRLHRGEDSEKAKKELPPNPGN